MPVLSKFLCPYFTTTKLFIWFWYIWSNVCLPSKWFVRINYVTSASQMHLYGHTKCNKQFPRVILDTPSPETLSGFKSSNGSKLLFLWRCVVLRYVSACFNRVADYSRNGVPIVKWRHIGSPRNELPSLTYDFDPIRSWNSLHQLRYKAELTW